MQNQIIEPHRLRPVRYSNEVVISTCSDREDVLLWRALHETKNGFFIDVGAGDPNWSSPTRWFSVNGWTGINVEPHPMLFPILEKWRPNDINVNCGISQEEGFLRFYKVNPTHDGIAWGLSSFNKDAGDRAKEKGYVVIEDNIQVRTLNSVIEDFGNGRTIDLLKIDVEGYEKSVVASIDLRRHRPRVMCIEATAPLSPDPSFGDWELLITKSGYDFCLFDGINNYYVREESPDLRSQFNCGLSSTDRYRDAVASDMKEPWL